MKKILYATLALAATSVFVACDDDNDDNPTLVPATEFVLNTPAYVNQTVDLSASDSLTISWSQPNFGFPLVVNYNVEVSASGDFTVSNVEAAADETGATVADYYQMDATTSCSQNVSAKDIDRAIATLSAWGSEADVPETQDVYIRVKAVPNATTASNVAAYAKPSNIVKLEVRPYYIALKDADPQLWYLIGGCIGDGGWTTDALGTSVFPMSIVSGASYNSNTGRGTIVFSGYFPSDGGFKFIRDLGSWTYQIGGAVGAFEYNNGGSTDIKVSESGYYTVTLNTASSTFDGDAQANIAAEDLTVVAMEKAPTVFESICLSGDFNSWGDTPMTAFSTADCMAGHNHLWVYTLDVPEGGTTLKFKMAGSWDSNWGGNDFPYGVGVGGGDNISVGAGTWNIFFNDVDGSYEFFSAE